MYPPFPTLSIPPPPRARCGDLCPCSNPGGGFGAERFRVSRGEFAGRNGCPSRGNRAPRLKEGGTPGHHQGYGAAVKRAVGREKKKEKKLFFYVVHNRIMRAWSSVTRLKKTFFFVHI